MFFFFFWKLNQEGNVKQYDLEDWSMEKVKTKNQELLQIYCDQSKNVLSFHQQHSKHRFCNLHERKKDEEKKVIGYVF